MRATTQRARVTAARRALLGALSLATALALASCVGGGDSTATQRSADTVPVRIGTKNFTESKIVGELYKQALEAKGLRVDLQSEVGSTEVIHTALLGGFLDMYPEYVGVLLSEVDEVHKRPASGAAAYRLAKRREERGPFTLLEPTRASNENALAVTHAFARRHDVHGIEDIKRLGKGTLLGAPPEFRNRFEGLRGLRRLYGLHPRMLSLAQGRQYGPLRRGRIDVAVVFTTDAGLARAHLTVLRDPLRVFAEQHIVPVISRKALKVHGPLLARTINAVSALLTTPVVRALNAKVDVDGRTPRVVADEFLVANKLKPAPSAK